MAVPSADGFDALVAATTAHGRAPHGVHHPRGKGDAGGGSAPHARREQTAGEQAAARGGKFKKLAGDMSLIRGLVDGPWDDDRFLVVRPGHQLAPSFDETIINAVRTDA